MADTLSESGVLTLTGQPENDHGLPAARTLEIPTGCRVTQTSLIIADTTSKAEWEAIGGTLATMEGAVQFWIGDWLRFGEDKQYIRKNKYDEAVKQTGMKRGTLKVYASVAKNVPSLMRINQLSFQHHQLVASCSREEQEVWLKAAVDEQLTVKKLRAAMYASSPRGARSHDEELGALKSRLRRVVEPYAEWIELDGVRTAIEAIDTASRYE